MDPQVALQARLTQAEQQAQAQAEQIQQQQHQIGQLQQALAAAVPVVAPPPGGVTVHRRAAEEDPFGLNRMLSRPTPFWGEVGDRVGQWLGEMDLLFANYDRTLSDTRKITFALQYLKGHALLWWQALARSAGFTTDQQSASVATSSGIGLNLPNANWAAFKTLMLENFGNRQNSESARAELHRLRQYQFRDMDEYIEEFEVVAHRIEVPLGQSIDEELISEFKAGLSEGQVRLFLSASKPQTLLQAFRFALQADQDLRAAGMRSSMRGRGLAPHRGDLHRGSRFANSRANGNSWGRPRFASTTRIGSHMYDRSHVSTSSTSSANNHGPAPMELGSLNAAVEDVEDETWESGSEGPDAEEGPDRKQDSGSESASDRGDSSESNHVQLNVCSHCGAEVNTMQTRSRVRGGPPVCWSCGQPGHVQRDCSGDRPHKSADKSHRAGGTGGSGSAAGSGSGAGGNKSRKPDSRRGNFR
jgi:hypothetical protein